MVNWVKRKKLFISASLSLQNEDIDVQISGNYLFLFTKPILILIKFCKQVDLSLPPLNLGYATEAADEDNLVLVDESEGETSFSELERYLTEAKDIIVEQHEIKNYRFVKNDNQVAFTVICM